MDLPDKDGNWTSYNQTRPPRYEHFPNPGDPDYVPYYERTALNKHEWGPRKAAMDKITEEWLKEMDDRWWMQKLDKENGPRQDFIEAKPRYDLQDDSKCAEDLLASKPRYDLQDDSKCA